MCHVRIAFVTGRDGEALKPPGAQRFCGISVVQRVTVLLVLFLMPLSDQARGDWLNATGAETAPNFAEISILEDRVRIALEIDFADFPAFAGEQNIVGVARSKPDGEPDAARLSKFTGGAMSVLVDGATPLEPTIKRLEIRDRKARPTAQTRALGAGSSPPASNAQRSPRVVYAELDYVFSDRPQTLTFSPPLDNDGRVLVTIGFLAHHGKVPVTDYRYLSVPEMIALDWNDPWYSAFENPNLTRHHKSALMSFLTVEPREVRHEVIFRLRDLEVWSDLELGDGAMLDAAQIGQVKKTAERFFALQNPVVIDGVSRKPATVQAEVLDISVAGLKVLENPDALDRTTALLGVISSYPHRTLPKRVELTWQLFTDEAGTIPARITDPAGGVPGFIRRDDPVVVWTNFLKSWEDPIVNPVTVGAGQHVGVPILSLVLAGIGVIAAVAAVRSVPKDRWRWAAVASVSSVVAVLVIRVAVVPLPNPFAGSIDERSAQEIVEAMLLNTGAALVEVDDSRFSEALSSFVPADRADAVGAELKRGLSVTLPSGALARTEKVDAVVVEEITDRDDETGISLLANWKALVSGGHWGHMHRRRLRYRALMDVVQIDGAWKLQGLTVISARPGT
jgi:hypothetical protein